MKVLFVAAPLVARTGVYRSAQELVSEGRRQGLDWHLYLGVSERAQGQAAGAAEGILEARHEPSGMDGVRELRSSLRASGLLEGTEVIVSLLPQSDIAVAGLRLPWVAYIRGLPWPAPGEARMIKRLMWKGLELATLRRANERWVTTSVLKASIGHGLAMEIVPPGLCFEAAEAQSHLHGNLAVWAARFDEDKNPRMLLDIARRMPDVNFAAYGTGPAEPQIRALAPANLDIRGWSSPGELWDAAGVYIGTSSREAFGRSAVEAASRGVVPVISDVFGAADLLFTDDNFRRLCVLPLSKPDDWVRSISALYSDSALRSAISAHVQANALSLSVEASAIAVNIRLRGIASETRFENG